MMRFLPALSAWLLFAGLAHPAQMRAVGKPLPPPAAGKIDFAKDVQPILVKKCISCHGAEKQRGGLRLDHGKLAMQGGNSGIVIRPRQSANSKLIHLVTGMDPEERMPPAKGKELTAAEVGVLRAWIDQGATWPESAAAVAGAGRSSHWAF